VKANHDQADPIHFADRNRGRVRKADRCCGGNSCRITDSQQVERATYGHLGIEAGCLVTVSEGDEPFGIGQRCFTTHTAELGEFAGGTAEN